MSNVDEDVIRAVLIKAGYDGDSITLLKDAGEAVYEFESDGDRYFVKVLPAQKGRPIADVLELGIEIGIPSCELISVDPYVLIMEEAPGRPLSVYLPLCLFPGIWWSTATGLAECLRQAGIGLGNLHSGTCQGRLPAADDTCRIAHRIRLDDRVAARFDRDTAAEIREAFASVRATRLPVATIHGDPTPHNVFWHRRSREGTLIDFNGRTSVALDDVVVVEAGLELMTRRVPYSRASKADRLIRSFRAGYRSTGVHDPIPIEVLRPLKLGHYCHLLDKIIRAPSPATLQQRVTRFTDAPIIERRILALLETIGG